MVFICTSSRLGPAVQSSLKQFFPVLSAGISGKAYRVKGGNRPPPFPYKEKKYTFLRSMVDKTTSRFDENTKLVIVEGPVASGKTAFAAELAEELDMHHIPEANMDLRYINAYGYNMRELDPKLPESVRSYDEKDFCRNPTHFNAASFQIWMYKLRFSKYIDALAHILSTGQGVVMERSPYSDQVFADAMYKHKYISRAGYEAYKLIRANTLAQLMRPHLVIYLDVPVDKVMANIKARNLPYETQGKALTKAYLQDVELSYKTNYLKDISTHAELLMYDWSEKGDLEVVVEDIERIDFDRYNKNDEKMRDWRKFKEQFWADTRMLYCEDKERLMSLFNIMPLDATELLVDGQDVEAWDKVWNSAPGMEYTQDFNPIKGDTNLLFKTKSAGDRYVPY